MILLMVNGFIVYFNIKRTDSQTNYMVRYGPLHFPMQLLLFLHTIQFLYLRHIYDTDRVIRIKPRHKVILVLHIVIYTYVISKFYFSHDDDDKILSRQIWIPMDIILTHCFLIYFIVHYKMQHSVRSNPNILETHIQTQLIDHYESDHDTPK